MNLSDFFWLEDIFFKHYVGFRSTLFKEEESSDVLLQFYFDIVSWDVWNLSHKEPHFALERLISGFGWLSCLFHSCNDIVEDLDLRSMVSIEQKAWGEMPRQLVIEGERVLTRLSNTWRESIENGSWSKKDSLPFVLSLIGGIPMSFFDNPFSLLSTCKL